MFAQRVDETKIIEFDDFFRKALFFLKTGGSEPYLVDNKRPLWKTVLIKAYYIVGLSLLDVLCFGEIVTFKMLITDPEYFIIATSMAPCILFIVACNYKEYILYVKKETMYNIFQELRELFPTTLKDQIKYQTHSYCYFTQKVELVFITSCIFFLGFYSAMPTILGLNQILLVDGGEWNRALPYDVYYPFDTTQPLSWHILLYVLQMYAAYLAGIYFTGGDLLMWSVISQNCMHLNYIKRSILKNKPDGGPDDINFLRRVAEYHGKILK